MKNKPVFKDHKTLDRWVEGDYKNNNHLGLWMGGAFTGRMWMFESEWRENWKVSRASKSEGAIAVTCEKATTQERRWQGTINQEVICVAVARRRWQRWQSKGRWETGSGRGCRLSIVTVSVETLRMLGGEERQDSEGVQTWYIYIYTERGWGGLREGVRHRMRGVVVVGVSIGVGTGVAEFP